MLSGTEIEEVLFFNRRSEEGSGDVIQGEFANRIIIKPVRKSFSLGRVVDEANTVESLIHCLALSLPEHTRNGIGLTCKYATCILEDKKGEGGVIEPGRRLWGQDYISRVIGLDVLRFQQLHRHTAFPDSVYNTGHLASIVEFEKRHVSILQAKNEPITQLPQRFIPGRHNTYAGSEIWGNDQDPRWRNMTTFLREHPHLKMNPELIARAEKEKNTLCMRLYISENNDLMGSSKTRGKKFGKAVINPSDPSLSRIHRMSDFSSSNSPLVTSSSSSSTTGTAPLTAENLDAHTLSAPPNFKNRWKKMSVRGDLTMLDPFRGEALTAPPLASISEGGRVHV
jgi:hypothetical protein